MQKNMDNNNDLVSELLQRLEKEEKIPQEFFEDSKKFNPFAHWNSDIKTLKNWSDALENAISETVEYYHKGFNAAADKFGPILESFTNSQQLIGTVKRNLYECSELFDSANIKLKDNWSDNVKYGYILDILSKADFIQKVPDIVDILMEKKQYLRASILLEQAMLHTFSTKLGEIVALKDIFNDFMKRKNHILSILGEELQDIIYLKKSNNQNNNNNNILNNNDDLITSSPPRIKMNKRNINIDENPLKNVLFDSEKKAEFEDLSTHIGGLLNFEKERGILHILNCSDTDIETRLTLILEAMARLDPLVVLAQNFNNLNDNIREVILHQIKSINWKPHFDDHSLNIYTISDKHRTALICKDIMINLMSSIFQALKKIIKNHVKVAALVKHHLNKVASESHYSLQNIWNAIVQEIVLLLQYHLHYTPASSTGTTDHNFNHDNNLNGDSEALLPFQFKFALSNIPSIAEMSRGIDRDEMLETERTIGEVSPYASLLQPSPYYIVSLLKMIYTFINDSKNIMLDILDDDLDCENIHKFLNQFLRTGLLSRIQEDINTRLQDILNNQNAFQSVDDIHVSVPICRCVVEATNLLSVILTDLESMKHEIYEFNNVIRFVVDRVLQKCQEKYAECSKNVYSATRLTDSHIIRILEHSSEFLALTNNNIDNNNNNMKHEDENTLYQQLESSYFQLDNNQLMFSEKLRLIALIHESLNWFAQHLLKSRIIKLRHSMTVTDFRIKSNTTNNGHNNSIFLLRPSIMNSAQYHSHLRGKNIEQENLEEKIDLNLNHIITNENRHILAKKLQNLSNLCLFTLRFELHCHCFHFLSAIQSSSYFREEEADIPETFVLNLNKDLLLAEDDLSKYLESSKMQYIFDGMSKLICKILLNKVKRLDDRRFTKNGINQMIRNISALRQNLSNMGRINDKPFDDATNYFLQKMSDIDGSK